MSHNDIADDTQDEETLVNVWGGEQTELPMTFCVDTASQGQLGFYLVRWSHSGFDTNNKKIHTLKPGNHYNRSYTIHQDIITDTIRKKIITKKNNGTITRPMEWSFTTRCLKYHGITIPVLRISPFNALSSMKPRSFIPITEPVAIKKKYKIETIPYHVIRALLRDAILQEETCPITTVEIDVSNGAITSCFHIFEKEAIKQWLSLPSSNDKCPVCNTPCNSYTLD